MIDTLPYLPRVVAAGAWYESVTTWTIACTIVGLLSAIAIIATTFIAGFPSRNIVYWLEGPSPDVDRQFKDGRSDEPAASASEILKLEIRGRGRRDIPSDAFDDERPLSIDIGTQIVQVLDVESKPEALPRPRVSVEGTSINIGPDLINRRHNLTIYILTDGGATRLTCASPLIDTQIREWNREPAVILIVIGCIFATGMLFADAIAFATNSGQAFVIFIVSLLGGNAYFGVLAIWDKVRRRRMAATDVLPWFP
jgi:hypothetical protein